MASWWKLIAQQAGAMNSSGGAYAKRMANKLGAQNNTGHSWEAKVANEVDFGATGAYGRRCIDHSKAQALTPYGTAGSYGRTILKQNLLVAPAPGQHSVQPPAGGIGAH